MDWSKDYFEFLGPHYHELYDHLTPARTRREIDAVLQLSGVPAPGPVVDLGCGPGRHAVELARRGYEVTAIDQARSLLQAGAERARRHNVSVEWVEGDLRTYEEPEEFALGISLFNTFGYASDADNAQMMQCAARSLRPGGTLVVEMFHRDHYVREFVPQTWEKKRRFIEITAVELDCYTSRFEIDAIYVFADHREGHHFSIRVYSLPEMEHIVNTAGLEIEHVFGGLDRRPLSIEADRLVLVLRKPGRSNGGKRRKPR